MKILNRLLSIIVLLSLLSGCVALDPNIGQPSIKSEAANGETEANSSSSVERITSAMSAGPPAVTHEATIADWPAEYPGNWPDEPLDLELVELRPGTNGWTCIADAPDTEGNDPMCLNETYLEVLMARHASVDSPSSGIGIGYMLQEGSPVGSPPHMMIFVPESSNGLTQFTTEPGPTPWVMFPDTSHAHIMVTMVPSP